MTRSRLRSSHALDDNLHRAGVVWLGVTDTFLTLLVIGHVRPGVGLHLVRTEGQADRVVGNLVRGFSWVVIHLTLGTTVPVTLVS